MLKIWVWLKSYWYIPLIIILAIVLGIFLRRENNIAMQLLDNAVESYKKQIEEINRLNAEKEKQKEELQRKYELVLKELELKYQEEQKVLDEKEKKRVKELVEKYKDNPDGLTQELANAFGLRK